MLQSSNDSRSESNRNATNRYIACLLRLWQDGTNHPWRASVQLVPNGEIMRFAGLDPLFAYLKAQITQDERMQDDQPAGSAFAQDQSTV